jgi:hypothetical protein
MLFLHQCNIEPFKLSVFVEPKIKGLQTFSKGISYFFSALFHDSQGKCYSEMAMYL